jgi:sarcosine oxidase subunit alpha
VGLLDASTLGKLVVKGSDAGRFLDMMYTNIMSTLPVGKCRYGLMCTENGFLTDDGVVVRLAEDTWLCHTTTGGADRIHAHMEDWLQTEWHGWQVYTANLTEQWAQIAVAGPRARDVLQKLGGMDLSREALPFMTFAEGTLGNRFPPASTASASRASCPTRSPSPPPRASPSGRRCWTRPGVRHHPYGTEALHVLRAEKG